ncbi:CRISPR-associated helicase Cas3' [Tepidibacillus infernus]|uniref:CRISPR-associated helicase Cas3' n=1 Tax=Tepidibacillus infernus TaxID=1806172 RepID=UPI003B70591C
MSYYAHYYPDKGIKQALNQHLLSVVDMTAKSTSSSVRFCDLSDMELNEVIRLESLLHDFGKYTMYFQQYLLDGISSDLKSHAHISACFLHPWMLDSLPKGLERKNRYSWAFLTYLSVRMHHGNLTLKGLFDSDDMWERLEEQSQNLIAQGKEIYQDLGLEKMISYEQFLNYLQIENLRNEERNFLSVPIYLQNGRFSDVQWYFVLIYLFSTLIDADKLDSVGLERTFVKTVSPQRVITFLQSKHKDGGKTDLNDQRNKARESIQSVIKNLTKDEVKSQRFFTLTAPTGIGKTLSALQCALDLQERIQLEEGYIPRIITAIPFINIIEQTEVDYRGVFGHEVKLITHHRFTDFSSANVESNEERSLDQSLLEVESWEADVVLTTFVQLFQSLLTGENRLLKKINKLAGSIVILDEIQAIPEEYMPLIGALLRKISQFYGTRFILMTATQPKLLELGDLLLETSEPRPVELLTDHEEYFKGLKRTKFVPLINETHSSESFVSLILEVWKQSESALIVVNTIKRSIDIFNKLKEKKVSGEIATNVEIYYLSTNIIPKQRKTVIDLVKKRLKEKIPVVLVSTQTIEAGVDLDFDLGFRDLAPIESIIQTAGRINREGKKGDFKPLYILKIEKDHEYVYMSHHLDRTEKILGDQEQIPEIEYRSLVKSYYKELMLGGVSDKSRTLWQEGVVLLDFDKLKEFQLIKDIGQVVDLYVELPDDHESTLLADSYKEIMKNEWAPNAIFKVIDESIIKSMGNPPTFFERKALLRILLTKMGKYMIQVRVQRAKENRPIEFITRNGVEASFYWIPPDQLSQYYDMETGFKEGERGGYFC